MKNNRLINRLIKRYKRKDKIIKYIERITLKTDIKRILIGIYLIESNYRNIIFRFGEYVLITIDIVKAIIFKSKIKNYTIGIMQLGIANILRYYGYLEYKEHDKYIKDLSLKKIKCIFKGIYWKKNIVISKEIINKWYNEYKKEYNDFFIVVGLIGEKYNGKEIYGLLLLRLVEKI